MPAMKSTRVIFVTGKGGVGKSTVAAALAQEAAAEGLRTLVIETGADGNLAGLFGRPANTSTPQELRPRLDAVRVDPRSLVEEYFRSVLRFAFLANRLFESDTFRSLTAAAPGITEFLLLDKVLGLVEPGFGRRRRYDLIVLDGPATGHALELLRTPRNLLSMVPGGPLSSTATRLRALLEDPQRTLVLLVSLAEDMSVRETIEMCHALRDDLHLSVGRTIVNRVFPKRFSGADLSALESLDDPRQAPLVEAARFALARRREAERHVSHLRRALGESPVLFRHVFAERFDAAQLQPLGRTLGRAFLEPHTGSSAA